MIKNYFNGQDKDKYGKSVGYPTHLSKDNLESLSCKVRVIFIHWLDIEFFLGKEKLSFLKFID